MTATEDIRRKVDIVELIGESVTLKPSGQNFKANCPFHNERTPSFYVDPARQSWHCFGACATGGDVFSFVMRKEGVDFPEALRLLATRAGVQLDPRERSGGTRHEELKAANRAAAMFFHDALLTSPDAAHARAHLEGRGISRDTIEDYRLGYSPEGPGLLRSLAAHGHKEEVLLAAGLLRKRDDGSTFPFFRNRLMVPIFDAKGEYIGFGARALDDSKPKYLNTGQTPVFDKSSVLYGLHRAADAIKAEGTAVLVEGYMDVLMAHQYGFKNVVAAMGTALSDKQVAALKRLAGTFVLALDPDAAGDEATLRSLESSWKVMDQPVRAPTGSLLTGRDIGKDLVLKVMDLPRGVDPDDLIRGDPTQWTRLIAEATPLVDYVFRALAARADLTTSRGKAVLTQRLAPFILQASNVYEQDQRVRRLATLLQEDEALVRRALSDSRQPGRRPVPRAPSVEAEARGPDPAEMYCLANLLRYPELAWHASELTPEHFSFAPHRIIFEMVSRKVPPERVRERLPEELVEDLDALLAYSIPLASQRDRERGVLECVRKLEKRKLDLEFQALAAMIDSDPGAAMELQEAAELKRAVRLRIDGKSG